MNNIRLIREQKGMLQKDLAQAAQISGPFLFDLEKGNRNAKPETLARIAAALGCSVEDLTGVRHEDRAESA